MAEQMAFHLFGDQSLGTYEFLAEFFRQWDPSILSQEFLKQVGDALRDEIDSWPRVERERIPTFRTLQQLNSKYHKQDIKFPGIDSALLCVAQLAHYIE
jgi:hypothetical protein